MEQQRPFDEEKIRQAVRMILEAIGEDPDREGLIETPARVARMYREICNGLHTDPRQFIKVFKEEKYDELVLVKDIPLYSLCVHGKSIVYTPDGFAFARDILPGDRLLTLEPESKRLVETEALAVSRTKHRERYRVSFDDGSSLVVTGEHPLHTLERGFVPAQELRIGEPILGVEPRRLCRPTYPVAMNYSLGYVLGTVASDGSEVVRHSRDTMQGFLDGYIDGDGHRAKSGKYSPGHFIISANRGFLGRMSELLDTPVGENGPTMGYLYVSRRWFQERNTGKGFKRGFQPEAQEQTLETVLAKVTTKVRRVQEVQREVTHRKPYTMYNFECAPYNSFLANGVLTHNCEHHLLPFIGTAHVGYIPEDNRVTGLSKIPRVVDALARKPQVQERLTVEIADVLMETLKPQGVIVVIEAEHLCVTMRGIEKPGTKMRTSVVRGIFRRRHASRDEALMLMGY